MPSRAEFMKSAMESESPELDSRSAASAVTLWAISSHL